ncbi:VCBS repeat-containing protein [Cellulophaga sp. BC115SP]|uniref:VCBS repeat-containing protein n=1 Tax=Cellulophaga sp. BC115SP TaxID=2683263 RepID=UPI00141349A9|nr:VCBS repeat-containing protein [Cellulophaga sp. BC115SP]NBB30857.1 RNA-binding protein [Cellulophaga sp. BC115SP]
MKIFSYSTFLILCTSILISCTDSSKAPSEDDESPDELFTLLPAEKTHVDFQNVIDEGLNTNVLMYEYFYNGGGVAVGDVNGDGYDDLYFTSNMNENKLYLNKTQMAFQDITAQAGVAGRQGPWKTGVTMVDINSDGKLDIYVCHSGNLRPEKKANELFINQGNDANGIPTFLEEATKYGLDSPASSTNAYFFDADKDGDLDLFLLNHNIKSLPVLNLSDTAELLKVDDSVSGSRFYTNDKGYFRDITSQAGIQSSALSYGLGAGIADFNQDGWPDIYVSNDYAVPDRLYLNNQKGGFSEVSLEQLGHTSNFSMGNDVADINNDLLPDIFTLDMLPEDNRRQKLLMAPDNYYKFDLSVQSGFHHQYMRNMLHLNNGNGSFSEIGQVSGISNTDWSWSALFADYDNDGWKDLYVTNGYLHDYTNLDFLKYMDDFIKKKQGGFQREDVLELVKKMPSSNVSNYMFRNKGNLQFANLSDKWGLSRPSNSSGAAYSDLDKDGDLDLVVNNINLPAFIYQNESKQKSENHYLNIQFKGNAPNTMGIGTTVRIYASGNSQQQEQMPTRGFQSNVSFELHFGLGKSQTIDSLKVTWASGKVQVLKNVKADQALVLEEKNATDSAPKQSVVNTYLVETNSPIQSAAATIVQNDFKRQSLLTQAMSFVGPVMIKADVNQDGLEDVFVGGCFGKNSELFIQNKVNGFSKQSINTKTNADISDATFFDANGDGKVDLYVAYGGYRNFTENDPLLQDQLFINNGKGGFTLSASALPAMPVSTGCVRVGDVNQDGKPDLFVGGRVIPGRYPETPRSYILINQGNGTFKDQTPAELQKIGMVTDAAFVDLNQDKKQELLVVGEWMPISVFTIQGNKIENQTDKYFDKNYQGWWNKIIVEDLNGDGKPEILLGNQGLNSQCKVSFKEPAELYFKDFDQNGTVDPILCTYVQGKSYPYLTRDELLEQLTIKRKKFTSYDSYGDATLKDIFDDKELEGAEKLTANYLKTGYFTLNAQGKFEEKALPIEAQFAPVYNLLIFDYNKDGKKDILLAGNQNITRLKFGKSDANYGLLLQGDGKGNFVTIPQNKSGLKIKGDVRSVLQLNQTIVFGINQQAPKAYKIQ